MKNKGTAVVLALLLGGLGGHKFYLNQTGAGLLYILFCWTFIPQCIALVEVILLIIMTEDEFNNKYNKVFIGMFGGNKNNQEININLEDRFKQNTDQIVHEATPPTEKTDQN